MKQLDELEKLISEISEIQQASVFDENGDLILIEDRVLNLTPPENAALFRKIIAARDLTDTLKHKLKNIELK